jgi:hypothetical protein
VPITGRKRIRRYGSQKNGSGYAMNLYEGSAVPSVDRLNALHHITLMNNPIGQPKSIWIYPHVSFFVADATQKSIKDTISALYAKRILLNTNNVGTVYRMK